MQMTIHGQIAYSYTGSKSLNPDLQTVVFIHGAQNDHSVWGLQSRYFANHGYNVLAVDLPGHGRSQGLALASVEAMADWIIALLNSAGIRQAALIGHSMGSLIALETCHRIPERITHLALLGSAYPMKVSDTLLATSRDNEQLAIDMVNIWSHSSIAHKPSCPGPGFSVLGGSKRLMQRISALNPTQVFYNDFSACNAYSNGEAAAQSVNCPCLFLSGKKDMMTPVKATKTLSQLIRHCQTVLLDQCGHSLMAEQPDAVLDTLRTFLKN
ncbi:alpha/beta fold hydrolase [Undibacterium oligocarboniphilum]|uniref:Alpha/beta hydrolase n=1 Tax=Undibacterium oligocarboniphilum TaxID=666702 RepID=A0A850Q8V7_9BURK|nr:alpha/beta hydrolase [Undibacterium oligocarboniphilum]MBC3868731.1 alpha/beta hydrolase [Undibacterium oligocarboniphilum]NVO76712.1 alpha/beta hydrolase [Undibacterium oligocarboniphilum]